MEQQFHVSAAEDEYMALCETVKEAVYLQQEIGLKEIPVTIFENNQPCIHIASNPLIQAHCSAVSLCA